MSVDPEPTRPLTRLLLGLAYAALTLSASDAAAQKQAATTSDYRLTVPVLRKVMPAADAGEGKCTEPDRSLRELAEMTVPQTEAWMNGCAPIQQAAAAREITTREVAQVVQAWMQANWRMTQEEVAKEGGETAAPLLPGALRDNVALLRQHMDEIARLDEENRP